MAALNFPPSPALNDIFSSGDRSWIFNGTAWQLRPRTTDNIAEGTTNLYYTDARVAAAPAVTALQTDLASEVSTRTTEIARIDTRVDNVLSNIDPVALDSLTEVVTAFQNADGSISDALAALSTAATSALGVETAARIAGDSDLQDAIDAEATRAQGVEAQLNTDLASEVTARTTAISTEQAARAAAITAEQTARATAISTEQAARAAAISTEQTARATAISTETSAREAAILAEQTARQTAISSVNTRVDSVLSNIDPAALDSLTEVVAAFQDADGSLSTTIANLTSSSAAAATAEQTRALAAEAGLQTAIDAEETRALAAEAALSSDIDDLDTALAAEVSARGVAVLAEQTRALAAESALSTAISTEVTDRGVAVLAEQDRALAAEAALSSDLSAVNTRVDNVLSNIDPAALDSLTEVVTAFQSADSSINGAITSLAESAAANLVIERDARIAADAVIDTTVSTLTDSIPDRVRAVLLSGLSLATNAAVAASDSVLTAFGKLQAQVTAAFASIDSEVSTRVSEISRLDSRVDSEASRLDTEISDRTNDVQSVRDALATEVSDRQSDVQSVRDITDGLGTMSTQNSDAVNITGGTITGVTVNAQSMEVGTGATADLFVGNDGKVGIGTEAPTEKLTVNGNIDILGGEIKNLSKITAQEGSLKVQSWRLVIGNDSNDFFNSVNMELTPSKIRAGDGFGLLEFEEARLERGGVDKFSWNFDSTPGDSGDDINIVRVRELNTKQIKLVVSETAPAHIDGREWLDTTDFRRYISISSAWVESITA